MRELFLDCKVFNTSVEKFVEIKAGVSANFRQFNILPRIALFVCNIGLSSSTGPHARQTIALGRAQNLRSRGVQGAAKTTQSDKKFVTSLVRAMPPSKLSRENEFKEIERPHKDTRGRVQKS
ncbi:MAG TPA: hypothetical protein VF749_15845 [Candidatus Acidoferrum sp.]